MAMISWRERLTPEQRRELDTAVPGSLIYILAQMLDAADTVGDAAYQLARHPHKDRHGRIQRLDE
jgi:hypothetical protein